MSSAYVGAPHTGAILDTTYTGSSARNYVRYGDPVERRALDQNNPTDRDRIVVFPGRIYAGEAFPMSQYVCASGPRDTNTNYLFRLERQQHPDHFSLFGYAEMPNGYGTGSYSRGYNTPPACWDEPEPDGMAPARFYADYFHDPYNVRSAAYNRDLATRLAI